MNGSKKLKLKAYAIFDGGGVLVVAIARKVGLWLNVIQRLVRRRIRNRAKN